MLRVLAFLICLFSTYSSAQEIGGTSGIASAIGSGASGGSSRIITDRSILNMNLLGGSSQEYILNNCLQNGPNWLSYFGANYSSGTIFNSAILDAAGWPNGANVTAGYGGGCVFSGGSGNAGPWILYGTGKSTLGFNAPHGTFTEVSGVHCPGGSSYGFIKVLNGEWNVTPTGAKSDWCIEMTYAATPSGDTLVNMEVSVSDPDSTGAYIKGLYFGQAADFANWQSGLLYRTTWKQEIIQHYPGAIRTMNWSNGPSGIDCRWENRSKPTNVGWSGVDWTISPPYGATSGTNAIATASVTGTPPSPTHCEYAVIRLSNATTGGNGVTVSAISNAATPVVTVTSNVFASLGYTGGSFSGYISNACGTSGTGGTVLNITSVTKSMLAVSGVFQPHQALFGVGTTAATYIVSQTSGTQGGVGCYVVSASQNVGTSGSPVAMTSAAYMFVDGDTVTHFNTNTNLNYFPTTITTNTSTCPLADALHYCITNYNTTGLGAITGGDAAEVITFNVGSRGAFPISVGSGQLPFLFFSPNLVVGTYYALCFDKNAPSQSDGSGNWVFGAWLLCSSNGIANGFSVPVEIQVQAVNELNALLLSQQPGAAPIGLWFCLPFRAMVPTDPDYTAASDYPVNAINTIINGANGYAGLLHNAPLIVEKGDEDWNTGTPFYGTSYYCVLGGVRYGGATSVATTQGCGNTLDYSTVRSILVTEDIKSGTSLVPASSYMSSRIKFFLGGQVAGNHPAVTIGYNYQRAYGDTAINSDPWNIWFAAAGATPISHFDFFGYAPYVGGTSFPTLATQAAAWAACGNQACQEAAIGTWIQSDLVTCNTAFFCISWFTSYMDIPWAANMLAIGKCWGNYEGGWNIQTDGNQFTTQEQQFLLAARQDAQWGQAQAAYFLTYRQPGMCSPSDYTEVSSTWGYAFPDVYGGSGGVEGAGLSPGWALIGTQNQGQRP